MVYDVIVCGIFNITISIIVFIGHIYKGILINGSCQTCSQNDPNLMIMIRDELYVGRNSLWVNDRVYSSSDGKLLIGNIDNIPYKFDKKRS